MLILNGKINIAHLITVVIAIVPFKYFNRLPLYHKHKLLKSLNNLILCMLLVFHLRVMGCEIYTIMRKQLASTPIVYSEGLL